MKTISALVLVLALAATPSFAASFPGFRMEVLGEASGYLTSLVVDSKGTLYYSSQIGGIFRFENGQSTQIARVTGGIGMTDTGVLGMALLDDHTAAVHYTLPLPTDPQLVSDDVVSLVDLATGAETTLRKFVADVEVPSRGTSMLHHGGNPVAAPDGSIFVGIGEYGGRSIAQLPNWNGGKIWRVYRDGSAEQFAVGLRNPFDFVWDENDQTIIVPDNGDEGSDELHIATKGANFAYPIASARQPHPPGMSPPVYVWEPTISPTGTIALRTNDQLRGGIAIMGYVSKAVHYIPDIDARPLPDPLIVLDASAENAEFVDIAEAPDGTIYVADLFKIYRLITPQRGDCDGDGALTTADITALGLELKDGPGKRMNAQRGAHVGSWGCDANGDDTIDSADMAAMAGMLGRRRVVRAGGR